jgi:predicted PurR-regulated permease PerM
MLKERHHVKNFMLEALQYVVFASIILYFGRHIFIPLSLAALISFVIYPFCKWLEKRGFNRMTAIIINIIFLLLVLFGLLALLMSQLVGFLNEWPIVQSKVIDSLNTLSSFLADSYGVSKAQQNDWLAKLFNNSGNIFLDILSQTLSASAFSTVLMILIPVYSALILYYRELWVRVLQRLFPGQQKESIEEILSLTITAYHNFIKGMGLVYLLVGTLNSIGLLILGVPHAILFGFIASLLTFIPYVGIMIGSLLPIAMSWVTYDSVWYPVGVIAIFAFVQYLEANLIFPLAVSNRLHVNTLVMLVSIFIGGLLWGMAGMILFVPFVGILKLVADHSPNLKTLSLMLGTDTKD